MTVNSIPLDQCKIRVAELTKRGEFDEAGTLVEDQLAACGGRFVRRRVQLLDLLIAVRVLQRRLEEAADLTENAIGLSGKQLGAQRLDRYVELCGWLAHRKKSRTARRIVSKLLTSQIPRNYSGVLDLAAIAARCWITLPRWALPTLEMCLSRAKRRFGLESRHQPLQGTLRDQILTARERFSAAAKRYSSFVLTGFPGDPGQRREKIQRYTENEPVGFFRAEARRWLIDDK